MMGKGGLPRQRTNSVAGAALVVSHFMLKGYPRGRVTGRDVWGTQETISSEPRIGVGKGLLARRRYGGSVSSLPADRVVGGSEGDISVLLVDAAAPFEVVRSSPPRVKAWLSSTVMKRVLSFASFPNGKKSEVCPKLLTRNASLFDVQTSTASTCCLAACSRTWTASPRLSRSRSASSNFSWCPRWPGQTTRPYRATDSWSVFTRAVIL